MTPTAPFATVILGLGLQLQHASAMVIRFNWSPDGTFPCEGDKPVVSTSHTGICGHLGPDGPWQAVVLPHGYGTVGDNETDVHVGLWYPTGSLISEVVLGNGSSGFEPNEQQKVDEEDWIQGAISWHNVNMVNGTKEWPDEEFVQYETSVDFADSDGNRFLANFTYVPLTELTNSLPDGSEYDETMNLLGLGPHRDFFTADMAENGTNTSSFITQMREFYGEDKLSNSWSLHLGSAKHNQTGSLFVGGYDRNRVAGDVGVWEQNPLTWLSDVRLGVQTGGSPFNETGSFSVWQGLGGVEEGEQRATAYSLPRGTAAVILNPALPYIYLPPTNCEAIAEHLPVTYRDELGLYTWDTDDERYTTIVSSPAYLGFVLTDSRNKDITVKVPFQLLNLTLESPIVDEPTQYFPCVEREFPDVSDDRQAADGIFWSGYWHLGRAFLQAATVIYNYEQNVTFVAQAPGPDMEIAVEEDINEDNKDSDSIEKARDGLFEDSWSAYWTPLEEDGEEAEKEEEPSGGSSGLSGGAIAGIVVGTLAGAALLLAGLFFLWRRRKSTPSTPKQEEQKVASTENSPDVAPATLGSKAGEAEATKHELPPDNTSPVEASEGRLRPEMVGSPVVSEVSGSSPVMYEMEGSQVADPRSPRTG